MIKYNALVLFLSGILLVSCGGNRIYEENIDFENRVWRADSVGEFVFRIEDSTAIYNLYFNIRNTPDYPFHNIYINYNLSDSNGNVIAEELVNNNLFAEKTGEPLGDGIGGIFSHQFPLLINYEFLHQGQFQLQLQQYMRLDSLPGVVSFGIKVSKVDE